MADRKPSEIAELLGEIAQLVETLYPRISPALAVTAAVRLVAEHHRYWLDQQGQSDDPVDYRDESLDQLVAAKDQVVGITGGTGSAADLLNALHGATRASVMLAEDLPGDRQTDPPSPFG